MAVGVKPGEALAALDDLAPIVASAANLRVTSRVEYPTSGVAVVDAAVGRVLAMYHKVPLDVVTTVASLQDGLGLAIAATVQADSPEEDS